MEKLQCLVCGIGNGILGDIIKRLLIENDIEVLNCEEDFDDLLSASQDADSYLIVGNDNKQLPAEYSEIFTRNHNLIIVELLNKGKGLSLHMNDINEDVLNKIISMKV